MLFKLIVYIIFNIKMSENQKGLKTFEQVLKLQNVPVNITLTLSRLNHVLFAYSTLLLQGLPNA